MERARAHRGTGQGGGSRAQRGGPRTSSGTRASGRWCSATRRSWRARAAAAPQPRRASEWQGVAASHASRCMHVSIQAVSYSCGVHASRCTTLGPCARVHRPGHAAEQTALQESVLLSLHAGCRRAPTVYQSGPTMPPVSWASPFQPHLVAPGWGQPPPPALWCCGSQEAALLLRQLRGRHRFRRGSTGW